MEVRTVEDEGYFPDEGKVEFLLHLAESFLGEEGTRRCQFLFFLIVIDVEMGCAEDMPVEGVVLDLIAAEIELGRSGGTEHQCDGDDSCGRPHV